MRSILKCQIDYQWDEINVGYILEGFGWHPAMPLKRSRSRKKVMDSFAAVYVYFCQPELIDNFI